MTQQLRAQCPASRTRVVGVHDEPSGCQAVLAAGAAGLVLDRASATERPPAIEALARHDAVSTLKPELARRTLEARRLPEQGGLE